MKIKNVLLTILSILFITSCTAASKKTAEDNSASTEDHKAVPDLKFAKGLLMNDVSDEDIIEWIKPLGIQSEVSK